MCPYLLSLKVGSLRYIELYVVGLLYMIDRSLCPRAARAAAGPGRGNSLAVTDWYRGNSLAVTDWYRGNSLAVTDWYSRHPGPPWTTLRP
eukprot:COSAG06_NODE_3185_length_5718_cov_5.232960_9_plen_90_part_00